MHRSLQWSSMVVCGVLALVSAVSTTGGCGGKAVIDGSPSDGGGGSSTSSSGTGGSTSTSSSSTSSTSSSSSSSTSSGTGGGPGSLCAEACSLIDTCLDGSVSCTSQCLSSASGCATQQDDFLMCVIEEGPEPNCGFPEDCDNELDTLLSCKGVVQTGGTCSGGPGGSCSCDLTDTMANTYRSDCSKMGPGTPNDCSCMVNMQTIGRCSFDGPPECDPFSNCCRLVLNVPGYP